MKKTIIAAWLVVSSFVAGANATISSTLDQGLVANYQFNGNADDSSGLGNNATPVNVLYTADRNGVANSAPLFNGSNGYVGYPDSLFGPATTGFTWSLWVNPDTDAGSGTVMNHGAINGEAAIGWTGTSYVWQINFAASGWKFSSATNGGGLVHIVCVYQKATRAELWINGQLSASFVPPNENLYVLNGLPNYSSIGAARNINGVVTCFKGVIDDVRIYNRALSSAEVQQLFTLDAAPVESGTSAVLLRGDAAPGITGAIFATTGVPAMNDSLHMAFQAVVTGSNNALTKVIGPSNSGIWADDGIGLLQLVVRTGTAAPGTKGALFSALSDPVYNNNNAVAFKGTLKSGIGDATTHSTPKNNVGIWSNDGGALHLVARQGNQAPGMDSDVVFSSFTQFALPDQGGATNTGGVVLLAGVSGKGITSRNNQGIWAVNTAGTLQLIQKEGDAINGKTITALTFLSSVNSEEGQTRSFAQSTGDILYKATFADGSWGIYKVVFP
jgi:hypothetical protein